MSTSTALRAPTKLLINIEVNGVVIRISESESLPIQAPFTWLGRCRSARARACA